MWDEFTNSSGDLPGDDILIYGESFGPFHNYSEIINKLENLSTHFSNFVDVFSIGHSYWGNEIYGIKITDKSQYDLKTQILIVGQHHAREQITVENALYFIDVILNGVQESNITILDLLTTHEIYIIPSLNIDGALLISSNPWQRKTTRPIDDDGDGTTSDEWNGTNHILECKDMNNDSYIESFCIGTTFQVSGYEGIDLDHDGKIGEDLPGGVDLNRNYPYGFGDPTYSSDVPNAEDFCGDTALSENCSANLVNFVRNHSFYIAVSLHSGANIISCPKDILYNPKRKDDLSLYTQIKGNLADLIKYPTVYMSKNAGMFENWIYHEDKATIAICIETFGNQSALHEEYNNNTGLTKSWGVWDFFNPPANQVIKNCEIIALALMFLSQQVNPNTIITSQKIAGFVPMIIICLFFDTIVIKIIGKMLLKKIYHLD